MVYYTQHMPNKPSNNQDQKTPRYSTLHFRRRLQEPRVRSARFRFRWPRVRRRWGGSTSLLVWQRLCWNFHMSDAWKRERKTDRTWSCLIILPVNHPCTRRYLENGPYCLSAGEGLFNTNCRGTQTYSEVWIDIGIWCPLCFEHRQPLSLPIPKQKRGSRQRVSNRH